jgi:hypothetical protein
VVAVVVLVTIGPWRQTDPYADRVAELQANEDARHASQVTELTELTVRVHADLLPVLAWWNDALPVDGAATAQPVTIGDVGAQLAAVEQVVDAFGEPPSGSTDLNTARNGLLLSVELLGSGLLAFEAALDAEGESQVRLETLAADLRERAVDAWSVAATQLDLLNIDAGHGHVHIYLPLRPGDDVSDPHSHGDDHDDH